jgi:hypothetical protein
LARNAKQVTPLVALQGLDPLLIGQLARAARGVDAPAVQLGQVEGGKVTFTLEALAREDALQSAVHQLGTPSVLATVPGRDGALYVSAEGYGLAAGSAPFLAPFAPAGVDAARGHFVRSIKRLKGQRASLDHLAGLYPPHRQVVRLGELPEPGSALRQLRDAMRDFVDEQTNAETFVRRWLDARRSALAHGERLREDLERLLSTVFAAAEDYPLDPELRDHLDMTEPQLRALVGMALQESGWA